MSNRKNRNATQTAEPSANGEPENRLNDLLNPPINGVQANPVLDVGGLRPGEQGGSLTREQAVELGLLPATPAKRERDKRENFNPDANAENLIAVGFQRGDGGNWYTVPDANGGFDSLERVVQNGRYYLIRYVRPAGSPIPRPLFRTPAELVFYPR